MGRLGKIMFLLSGLSLLSVGVVYFLLREWHPLLWMGLGLFVIFAGVGIWNNRRTYSDFLSMKTTKEGMSMGTMILLVFALLMAVNFIAVRKHKTWDFSQAQTNSLSDQSMKVVKALTEDMKIRFFYSKGQAGTEEGRRQFRELVKKYQDISNHVQLDFIEVNERPDLTQEYGVNEGKGIVFVEYKGRKNRIDKIDEQELTSAMVKATRESEKTIYFVTGHGEKDIEDAQTESGLRGFKDVLEGNRYKVKNLVLTQASELPKDADLIFVVGSQQKFLDSEIQLLKQYLQNGGSLFLATKNFETTGLKVLLNSMGIDASTESIATIMRSPMGDIVNAIVPGMTFSSTHSITKIFGKNQFVAMQLPVPLKRMEGKTGFTVDDLVKTSEKSAAFADKSFQVAKTKGPFTVAMSIQGKLTADAKDFLAVVISDSDFLNNKMLVQNLNRDLGLNSAAFLSREENMISITPKEVQATPVKWGQSEFYIFVFGFVIPLPILMLVTSGVLWFRRRYA